MELDLRAGEAGIPTQGAYAPSKGAFHQMTPQMAVEYAQYGIGCPIAYGTVDTAIVHLHGRGFR